MFLAFSGYHLSFRKIKLPLFARRFYLTGTEFLFLGLLLGPQFLNLMDAATCQGLAPLLALLLGWVGLLFGFQFEISRIRRIPIEYLGVSLLEGAVTFGIVFAGVVIILPLLQPAGAAVSGMVSIIIGLGIGAIAVCAAQTGLALLAPGLISGRSKTVQLLTAVSTVDGLLAMIAFCVLYIYGVEMTEKPLLFQGPVFGLLACLFFLIFFGLMMARRLEDRELVLIVIGMAILSSGAAAMLGFSPLITNFILGIGLVNFSREKERIFRLLMNVEKPVYLILLVFLGVGWQLNSPWLFLLAAGLFLLRVAGKGLGGGVMSWALHPAQKEKLYVGFGLIDSGGLPLALLFDFQQQFPGDPTPYVVSVGLLMVLYNDLFSPHFVSFLLRREAS